MDATFDTVVVPLDLETCGDRAIDAARSLAALGKLPIQLVTVTMPGPLAQPAMDSLEQRAREHQLENWSPVVLLSDEPASAIADHLLSVDGLVVMATAAHGLLGELVSASESAELLARTHAPVLIIGPHVTPQWHAVTPTLLACIDPLGEFDPAIPVMARWMRSFGGSAPWFVEVLSPGGAMPGDDVRESGPLQRRAHELAAFGVQSEWEVLHGDDPVDAIESFAEGIDEPVLVVDSHRWTDPSHAHLHSVARRLAHRSKRPVLVVHHDGAEVAGAPARSQ